MVLKPVRILRRIGAAVLATALAASVLTACAPTAEDSESAPEGLEVKIDGDAQPTITVPETLETAAVEGLAALGSISDVMFGTPVNIELGREMPANGATLSRTYAAPLPDDVAVTFAFWDEVFQSWAPVPTTLSADRLTATAVVHHFSLWSDIMAGPTAALATVRDAAVKAGQKVTEWAGNATKAAGDALNTAAGALHWSVGNIFTTRVELPECDLSTPNWVIDLPTGVEVNDPVRFCAGHDTAKPDLLVMKARSNRGFGFPVALATEAAWEYNSTYEQSLSSAIATVGQVDAVIGESIAQLLNHGRFVGAGDEISFSIAPSAFQGYNSEFLLELPAPSAPQFLFSTISEQVTKWGVSRAEGTLAVAIVVAHCTSKIGSLRDIGTAAGAVLTCVTDSSRLLVETLEKTLVAQGYDKLPAGNLIRRVSMALALIPAAASAFDYFGELSLPRNARALTITLDQDALRQTDEGWLISSAGIGPATFSQSQDDADAAFGNRQLRCDGSAASAWFATAWGDGTKPSMMFVVAEGAHVENIPGAPATAAGVTLGTTAEEMAELGYSRGNAGPYGDAFEWEEDGVPFAAATNFDGQVWAIVVGMHYFPSGFCS